MSVFVFIMFAASANVSTNQGYPTDICFIQPSANEQRDCLGESVILAKSMVAERLRRAYDAVGGRSTPIGKMLNAEHQAWLAFFNRSCTAFSISKTNASHSKGLRCKTLMLFDRVAYLQRVEIDLASPSVTEAVHPPQKIEGRKE